MFIRLFLVSTEGPWIFGVTFVQSRKVLIEGHEGPSHWHFPNVDDTVDFADGELALRRCASVRKT